jgi:hypothetical protein
MWGSRTLLSGVNCLDSHLVSCVIQMALFNVCPIVSFRLVSHMSSMIRSVSKPIKHDLISHASTDQQRPKIRHFLWNIGSKYIQGQSWSFKSCKWECSKIEVHGIEHHCEMVRWCYDKECEMVGCSRMLQWHKQCCSGFIRNRLRNITRNVTVFSLQLKIQTVSEEFNNF